MIDTRSWIHNEIGSYNQSHKISYYYLIVAFRLPTSTKTKIGSVSDWMTNRRSYFQSSVTDKSAFYACLLSQNNKCKFYDSQNQENKQKGPFQHVSIWFTTRRKKEKNASSEMCNQLKSFSAFRKKWNDSIIHQKYRLNKCSFRLSSESHK